MLCTFDVRAAVLLRDAPPTRRPTRHIRQGIGRYVDAVTGYELHYVTITDPQVIATSGSDRHPILCRTDRPDAHLDGTVFTITEAELAAADACEVDDYRRIPCHCGPDHPPGSTYLPVSVHGPRIGPR
jgi:hypothetical protein